MLAIISGIIYGTINGGAYMEQNSQIHRDGLWHQIAESYGKIVYTYTTHWKTVDSLVKRNRYLKYTQIVLSAISTGGFIGSLITNEVILTCVGGIFSTILLALNLYFKDFNVSSEIAQHFSAANALWSIREDYISLLTDMPIMSIEEICEKRDKLKRKTAEIYKTAPKTNAKNYAKAQKALKIEEEQFFSIDELNQVLPKHLRRTDIG